MCSTKHSMCPSFFIHMKWSAYVLIIWTNGILNSVSEAKDFAKVGCNPKKSTVKNQTSYFSLAGRHLLSITDELQIKYKENGQLNCTQPAIDQFFGDFLTEEDRKKGGVVIHMFLTAYVFAALTVLCDEFFISSLEKICFVLKVEGDVAGATFMAAGSSAPELFIAFIGVFFTESDIGIGTIVGSSVFNMLLVVGICSVYSPGIIYLQPWPMLRDGLFYIYSITAVVIIIGDGKVTWYEALLMLLFYGWYIGLLYFNDEARYYVVRTFQLIKTKVFKKENEEQNTEMTEAKGKAETASLLTKGKNTVKSNDNYSNKHTYWIKNKKPPIFRIGDKTVTLSDVKNLSSPDFVYESPFKMPESMLKMIFWSLMLPMTCLFCVTIPDCRRPGPWQNFWSLTFLMSAIWLGILTYLLVWMVAIIGDTLGIPDTVMGLTFLAAGSSVPDALTSIFVARDGFGDIAMSNSVGSNIFDMLICIGLPWAIQTSILHPGSVVIIKSSGLMINVIMLLGTIIFQLISIGFNDWQITKSVGLCCFIAYAAFVSFACLYEMNILGGRNPPPCPRKKTW